MTKVILLVSGAIIGSFLNVVGLRLNSGLSLNGRSQCGACRKTLRWWELVPILSFIMLRGRCAHCQTRISWQYPLVELFTALVFATVPLSFIPAFCLYIVMCIYDLRHKVIPDRLVYTGSLYAFFLHLLFLPFASLDWAAGPILFVLFAALWLLSRGRVMGFGDAKLVLSLGLLLGAAAFSGVVLAFWIGAAVGIVLLIARKNITMKSGFRITLQSEIPFAPFLIVGSWLALITHLDLLHVALF